MTQQERAHVSAAWQRVLDAATALTSSDPPNVQEALAALDDAEDELRIACPSCDPTDG